MWGGNIIRHPMMRRVAYRTSPEGLPGADAAFARSMTVGMSHGLTGCEVDRVTGAIHSFAGRF